MTVLIEQGTMFWAVAMSVRNEPAFRLNSSVFNHDPTLWIQAPITVAGDTAGAITGVSVGLSWPEGRGWLVVDTSGSLTVTATAAGSTAYGFSSNRNWSQDVEIRGRMTVTSQGAAVGIETGDWGLFQVNVKGTLSVTGETSAKGIAVDGLVLNNTGLIEVSGPVAVAVATGDGAEITNTGVIRATSTSPTGRSVALDLNSWADIENSGRIEASVALRNSYDPSDWVAPFQRILNSGTMVGDLELGRAVKLTNSGHIDGAVTLSRENDVYDGALGVVTGRVSSGEGADSLAGGAGGETLSGGMGADTISGGGGDDVIEGGRDGDMLDGGDGVDTLDYSTATMRVQLDLMTGRADSSGEDTISGVERVLGSAFGDSLLGGAGSDTLEGGGGANYLRGAEGDDRLSGGADFDDIHGNMGDDTASGGAGDDWVVGGKDNDWLLGDGGGDIVYGNLGHDTCEGGDGADVVRGGQGNDRVLGGVGDDWLSGDRGDDTIAGGLGADVFHGSQDAGVDRIADFQASEGDRVQLDPGTIYTLRQDGADGVIDMGGGHQMVLVGVQLSSLPPGWIFGA